MKYDFIETRCECGWKRINGFRNLFHAQIVLERHWIACNGTNVQIQNGESNTMGKSIGSMKRGDGGPPLLKGSDVPKGTRTLTIQVKELRPAPDNFGSPAIIDFEKQVYDRSAWAVNITNLRAITRVVGLANAGEEDNVDFDKLALKLRGKKLTLAVTMANNPQTKKPVPSLMVDENF